MSCSIPSSLIDNAPGCYIDKSTIEGLGLFAGKDFGRGAVVVDYGIGIERWQIVRFSDLSAEAVENEWFVCLSPEICITTDDYSKFSFVNHCKSPNTATRWHDFKLRAARDIKTGEEITLDYRTEPRSTSSWKSWFNW